MEARSTSAPADNGAADLSVDFDLTHRPARADLHDPDQRREVESALTSVPGVLAARIVAGFERDVDEVHVVTSLDATPKHTVRDVQTVLMAKFGVTTDHRVVSVVQLDAEAVEAPASSVRVAIDRVTESHSGLTVTAEVDLRVGDEVRRHVHDGAATPAGRHRAVAGATLAGVRELLAAVDVLLELDGVDIVDVGGHTTAVSVLTQRGPRGAEVLSGTAIVRDAAADAVARSVLDAINRTLERALG